ncbi:hypothetical protein AMATHDRAFT_58579 [Amanita thiersii Skay4041]|uniref:Uncharacterized protein n=1 Tax=Amanita thiersii Skay4041 TaxID=703135 RepID=A0A2A9NTX7_9AGAR|nr:hypothetical protein AMATHDRAFT_58579 [Amanita thiersii Skay4041]
MQVWEEIIKHEHEAVTFDDHVRVCAAARTLLLKHEALVMDLFYDSHYTAYMKRVNEMFSRKAAKTYSRP